MEFSQIAKKIVKSTGLENKRTGGMLVLIGVVFIVAISSRIFSDESIQEKQHFETGLYLFGIIASIITIFIGASIFLTNEYTTKKTM